MTGAQRETRRTKRPAQIALTAVASLIACLAVGTAPAHARTIHVFSASFGSAGSGAGQLSNPQGLAVDQATGDIYVADTGNNRIDKFGPSGNFMMAFGADVGGTGVNTCTSTCAAGTSGSTPGQFTTPMFVAVDNSGGASTGDVYVGDTGDNLVSKFDSSGNLISSWGTGGQLNGSTATDGPFGSIAGIAVDGSGNLFVIRNGTSTMFEFAQSGSFITDFPNPARGTAPFGLAKDAAGNFFKVNGDGSVEKITSAGSDVGVVTGNNTTELGVDPAKGDLYADAGNSVGHYAFNGSGQVIEPDGSTCTPAPFSGCGATDFFGVGTLTRGSGVGVDSASGTAYVADAANKVDAFTAAIVPDVTTGAASNVQTTSATLNGTVNPDGAQVTDCHFDYGTTTSYGQTAACVETVGSGTTDVQVHADITGLQPDTTYHFRLEASNANGRTAGGDQTFTTSGPPTIDSESSTGVTKTTATLRAQINPRRFDTTYHFEYGTTTSYGTTVPVPDADIGSGSSDVPVSQNLTGLTAGATYHWRVVAVNSAGPPVNGADQTFTTVPVAQIDGVSASDVTPSSATLHAKINPTGTDSTYHFEYGTDTSYGTSIPIPSADIGFGSSDVTVSQQLNGLTENTTYHYRVVVQNAAGTLRSADHTFTYSTTSGGLPDGRGYELVTPPNKGGGFVVITSISFDGSSLFGAGTAFANTGSDIGNAPYQFTRTASGWTPTALNPPASEFVAPALASGVQPSADHSSVLLPLTTTADQTHANLYLRRDGSFAEIGPITLPSAAPNAGAGGNLPAVVQGGSSDLSHVVFSLLGPGFEMQPYWPFDTTVTNGSLYEYSGTGNSAPVLVAVNGGAGSNDLIGQCGTELGGPNDNRYNAVSADGGAVFFTVNPSSFCGGAGPPVHELFARIDGSRTVAISEPSPNDECTISACTSAPLAGADFQGASADGSKAVFLSTQQLTDTASEDSNSGDSPFGNGGGGGTCTGTVGPNGCNLYLYDFARPAGHSLTAVSAGDNTGLGPQVQGIARVSEDGSHVYFVAKGVLTSAANSEGQSAAAGAENLYVYERDASFPNGHTAFIAQLCSDAAKSGTVADPQCPTDLDGDRVGHNDQRIWQPFQGTNYDSGRPAQATPDGRFLVFTSFGQLTADDTGTARQVFRYDAQTGELVRVSIGEQGFNDNGNSTGTDVHGGTTDDARITTPVDDDVAAGIIPLGGFAPEKTMSDDGAYVFFQSSVGLTPQASDNVHLGTNADGDPIYAQNVYEYHDGHVSLISDGRDTSVISGASSVHLLGTDGSGRNVFFTTIDQLVPQDTDTQVDVYDARIGGGFPFTSPPPPCQGDACRGAPSSAPPPPTAASISFAGPGNLSPVTPTGTAKVRVLNRDVHGSAFFLRVQVPAKGRITITGAGIKTVGRSVANGGTYRLRVTLTPSAKRALKRRHRLKLKLRVGYTPVGGQSSTATVALTVKR